MCLCLFVCVCCVFVRLFVCLFAFCVDGLLCRLFVVVPCSGGVFLLSHAFVFVCL